MQHIAHKMEQRTHKYCRNGISQKVSRFIADNDLLSKKCKVVVALSGGSDSVAMLCVLKDLGYELICAHCNFHLRGEESDRDEHFVRNLCECMNVTLDVREFDTANYAQARKISIEMAARELRYNYFEELRSAVNAEAIVVAHHRDDCVETFLLNIVRGSGIKGLVGIRAKNGYVVRPMLCVTHQEILDELASRNQDYVTDSTNLTDEYMRNKVRLDILPLLRQINPAAAENIMTTIVNMQEVENVYNAEIKKWVAECVNSHGDVLCIDRCKLMQSPSPISVLHDILSPCNFNRSQMQAILHSEASGRIFSSVGVAADGLRYIAVNDRDEIHVYKDKADFQPMPLTECNQIVCRELMAAKDSIMRDTKHAYVDADKIKSPLMVRLTRTGDRIRPFGMKGTRLVSDILTDLKVDVEQKKRQLVVCDGDTIVWIVGVRSSEDYRVDGNSKRMLELALNE